MWRGEKADASEGARAALNPAPAHACYVACYVRDKKQGPASLQALDLYGAGTRSRTRDLLITSQLLYQLSYTGVMGAEYIDFFGAVNLSH
jgi:hypothetical protein